MVTNARLRRPAIPREEWRKALSCTNDATCVEVRLSSSAVDVRDGKNPDGPVLTFDRAVWTSFIDHLIRMPG